MKQLSHVKWKFQAGSIKKENTKTSRSEVELQNKYPEQRFEHISKKEK